MQMTDIKVTVEEGTHVEKTLRKFKRLCESYGVVKEYRRRKDYKKPSIAAKEKREAADKRRRKLSFKSAGHAKI